MHILRHKPALESIWETVDNILVLNGIITHCINKNKYLYFFCGLHKSVRLYIERDILGDKLIKIAIKGQLLNIIRSIYNNIKSRVKCNTYITQ